ncbi:MAG TPA: hypothetical protein VNL77_24990 [Roseiflexaceae bacterium]|nr:hypothetical protein [Roseiflexaceae bacterium]
MTTLTLHLRRGLARLPGERGALVLAALFALLLPLATPRVYATDEVQYYVYLRSLRFDGDLDFENDYRGFAALNPRSGVAESLLQPNRIRERTGLYGNIAPVGAAIMWAPFFLLADALVHLASAFGAQIPADGFSAPYTRAVAYASALYGFLGVLLCYRLARHYASQRASSLAAATAWLATPLVWYMFVQMPFAHATGLFLTALFLTIWHETRKAKGQTPSAKGEAAAALAPTTTTIAPQPQPTSNKGATSQDETFSVSESVRRSWSAWLALGLVGGLMTITREQLGLFLLAPALEALLAYASLSRRGAWRAAGGLLARHALFVAAFLAALAPQLAAYQALNGVPRPAGEVSSKLNWCSPHLVDTLVDYDPRPSAWCRVEGDFTAALRPFSRGAFVWSPALVPALAGLALLWRRDRLLASALALGFLAQTYVNGAFGTTWHLTGAFGFRRLIECTPAFTVGLALLADRLAARVGWRWALLPALLLVAWNAGLVVNASVFNAETQLRQGLTWPDLWRWQLEAPFRLASRLGDLLFNRCVFLENGRC